MSRVLLTGAGGFVGRHTLPALVGAGHEVHAVARRPRPDASGATWHEADLLAGAQVVRDVRPEVLLHLAWYAEPGKFWTSAQNAGWRDASLALLQTFVAAGGKRAVLTGSCAEYEWSRTVYGENAPCRPTTPYGEAKHELQLAASALAEQAGISLAWARLFFLYGPGEDPRRFVPAIARALLVGETAAMTAGAQVRDFTHIADVGAALTALADSAVTGPVNVASGEGVTLRALAGKIAAAARGGGQLDIGGLPDRPDEPASLVADVCRLRDEVGFTPKITLEEGVERTVEWWRQRLASETLVSVDAS